MNQKLSDRKISRRQFSQLLTGLGLSSPTAANALMGLNWPTDSVAKNEIWLSAQGQTKSQFGLGWITPNKSSSQQAPTNFRGHGLCQNPAKPEQVVMIARRPGTMGVQLNILTGEIERRFHCLDNHHMQGHACYSADGEYLYCTESDFSTGQGKITVRETRNMRLVNEFSSHGIGPHELALMPDQKTLVVANGGLLTHPDSGREVLNLASMRSTLSYIDGTNGNLLSEHSLEGCLEDSLKNNLVDCSKASIRHLDVAEDGSVAVAMQVQRNAMQETTLVPLAAMHKPGQTLQPLMAPSTLMVKLNDYMGSVKIHNQQRIAAFTSPRGDLAMFWHMDNLKLQAYHVFHDVCGLTLSADNKHFVLSNSAGKIRQINSSTLKENRNRRLSFAEKQWDNHMLSVVLPR